MTEPHKALSIPLAQRVDYLMIIASMAGADVVIDPAELNKLRRLCKALDLSPDQTEAVVMAAHRPTASIERHLEGLKDSDLKYTLLSDCIAMAHSDGKYGAEERAEVESLAKALDVTPERLSALEEVVTTIRSTPNNPPPEESALKHQGRALANRLASVGVPLGTVAALSAVGLETAGVSTGLAALAAGVGIASGFGALLGVGVGTFMGVRWLRKKIQRAH